MVQSKILVDTNAYLRLAQSIHPFLKKSFGKENYCLYVLPELYLEYKKSSRLKSHYSWVEDEEYAENRNCRLKTSDEQKKEISRTYDFMLAESQERNLTASRIDIKCLCYGYALKIPVVTDDSDMIQLGQLFEVRMIRVVELLKLMLDVKYIGMEKIEEIAQYLAYAKDLPKNFKSDYKKIFGIDPPVYKK